MGNSSDWVINVDTAEGIPEDLIDDLRYRCAQRIALDTPETWDFEERRANSLLGPIGDPERKERRRELYLREVAQRRADIQNART